MIVRTVADTQTLKHLCQEAPGWGKGGGSAHQELHDMRCVHKGNVRITQNSKNPIHFINSNAYIVYV